MENFSSYLSKYQVDYEVQEHIKERSKLKEDFLYDNVQESFMFFNNSISSKRVIKDDSNLTYLLLTLRDDSSLHYNSSDGAFNEYLLEVQGQLKGRGLLLDESNWFFFKSV